jgi:hypothetical protein
MRAPMKTFLRRLHPLFTACNPPVSAGLVLLVGALLNSAGLLGAQETKRPPSGSLSVEDVVTMVKSGLSDELIITAIKSKAKPFDLSTAEIIELKDLGVRQIIIEYLLDPAKPYNPPQPIAVTPPPAAPAAPPAPVKPSDPVAAKAPPEVGLYRLTGEREFSPVELRPVVPAKQAGKNTKLFGLLKGHIIGSVVDAKAKTRLLSGSDTVFFLRLSEKGSIDDYALLHLVAADGRRNLDFGTKPGKPVFPFDARVSFESKQVLPGLYRLTVRLKEKGEYLLFVLGSGDESKGLLGKGYDFGVD